MEKTNTSKILNYFLYIGIAIYVLSTLISFLFPNFFVDDQGPLMKELSNKPSILVLFSLLIFAPITEELIFRSWIKKNSAWKYISFIGICIASYVAVENIIYLCIVAFVFFYLFFILKNEKMRLIFLVSFTSLSFGIIHCGNFNRDVSQIVGILEITGAGFILSYLGLRFSFFYCILGHFVFNLISVLLMMFASHNYSGEINAPNYIATIEKDAKIKFFNMQHIYPNITSYEGPIAEIAYSLSEFNRDTIFKYIPTLFNNYKYKAVPQLGIGLSEGELFKDFVSYANLKLDTVKVNAFMLKIVDTVKLKETDTTKRDILAKCRIEYLVKDLREKYDLPIIISEEDSNYEIYFVPEMYRQTKEEYLLLLEKRYGIVLQDAPLKKAVVITISERYQ